MTDKIQSLAEKVMKWCSKKGIRNSKCVGIMHAQFANNEEVYIIALSGTGYKLSSDDASKLEPTGYHETWKNLMKNPQQLLGISENVIVAEFDAVHKACLAKYNKKLIDDKELFDVWVQRLDNWIGEWYKHYMQMRKANKEFTIRSLVEEGIKSTYLEQMKVEAPTKEEALLRYEYIVDFVTDCIPDYQPYKEPYKERPDNYKLPHRMKINELLMTKTPDEIKTWFEEELESPKLRRYKGTFEKFCKGFERPQKVYIYNNKSLEALLEEASSDLWSKYEKEYDEFQLPKGYITVSMIWGDIIPSGCKFSAGIINFFIQCAEDNALCTLVNYVEKKEVECQKVSWHAFKYYNKCREGQCTDSNCKRKKCKVDKCQTVKIKPLCAFCKVGFPERVSESLKIDSAQIHIEDTSNSDDLEGEIGDYLVSF